MVVIDLLGAIVFLAIVVAGTKWLLEFLDGKYDGSKKDDSSKKE
jgi:hypothetical protein